MIAPVLQGLRLLKNAEEREAVAAGGLSSGSDATMRSGATRSVSIVGMRADLPVALPRGESPDMTASRTWTPEDDDRMSRWAAATRDLAAESPDSPSGRLLTNLAADWTEPEIPPSGRFDGLVRLWHRGLARLRA